MAVSYEAVLVMPELTPENCKISLTSDPLSSSDAISFITRPDCGALSLFAGTTRDNFKGKRVLYLEYEAYTLMAVQEIRAICGRLSAADDVRRVYVAHRTGRVDVGETSIIVAASSPHRAAAISFVEQAVDAIKRSVPVWKREWYEDGSEWKENTESCCRRK